MEEMEESEGENCSIEKKTSVEEVLLAATTVRLVALSMASAAPPTAIPHNSFSSEEDTCTLE